MAKVYLYNLNWIYAYDTENDYKCAYILKYMEVQVSCKPAYIFLLNKHFPI